MAQPPVKRRIQPQLISPLVNAPTNPAFAAPALGDASLAPSESDAFNYVIPGPKEDAEYAARNGMKGRRMLVVLDCPSKEINFKKLLKAEGVSRKAAPPPRAAAAAMPPALGGIPLAPKQANNAYANTLARLERQWTVQSEGSSGSSSEEGSSDPDEAEQSGEESEAEEGGRGVGEYDMEDDFIDDDEFADFVEGDLRKPKESGFFINKGEIERQEEGLLQRREASPPKRTKKKKKTAEAEEADGGGKGANGEPNAKKRKQDSPPNPAATKQPKRVKPTKVVGEKAVPSQEPLPGGAHPATAPLAPAWPPPMTLAMMAAAAGNNASGHSLPASSQPAPPAAVAQPPSAAPPLPRQPSGKLAAQRSTSPAAGTQATGGEAYVPSEEMRAAVAELHPLVQLGQQQARENPSAIKPIPIPKVLDQGLTPFALVYHREQMANPAAKDAILDLVVGVFGDLYGKNKLMKRLDSLAKLVHDDLAQAKSRIKDHVPTKLQHMELRLKNGEGPPKEMVESPAGFNFDRNMENQILKYLTLYQKASGTNDSDDAILSNLLEFWPPGRMDVPCLREAAARAAQHPKAPSAARLQRKSSMDPEPAAGREPQPPSQPPAAPQPPLQSIPEEQRANPHAAEGVKGPTPLSPEGHPPAAVSDSLAESQNPKPSPAAQNGTGATTSSKEGDSQSPTSAEPRVDNTASAAPAAPQVYGPNYHFEEAIKQHADSAEIAASIAAVMQPRQAIINQVLMCAGPNGYTSAEIIEQAVRMKLAVKEEGWDVDSANNKRVIANTAGKLPHAAAIGGSRYAHKAFPGVKEKAAKEAELQESKKLKREQANSTAKPPPVT